MRSQHQKSSWSPEQHNLLLVAKGETVSEPVPLPKGWWILGRSSDCDIVVKHATVSRKHATLDVLDSVVIVTDLTSSNGTLVNEIRVRTQATLHPGGHIRFGKAMFALLTKPPQDWAVDSDEETDHCSGNARSAAAITMIEHGSRLSPAQHRILRLALDGLAEKQMASRLSLSTHTIHNHLRAIYRAFQVHSRAELFARLRSHPEGKQSTSS
jgi:DNA-binding CsgD family transcriptional regulator